MAHIHGVHRSIINRYENAVREDEMKGAKHPSEHADIEAELADARESLENLIVRLYEKKNKRKP